MYLARVCVSYNSKRKRRTFPYTTLTDWFCRCKNGVFSVKNGKFVVDEEQGLLGYEAESIGE
jgi:nitrite reductase/ring-hydroxylating ferredoxin subunit